MKYRFIKVVGIFMVLAFIVGLLPACHNVQAASSYVAILPAVLHSGRTEAISLALFAGDKLVKDNVEVTLLKDGKKVVSATQAVDGKGTVSLDIPIVADGKYDIQVKGGAFSDKASISVEKSFLVFLETDKPIYKPGQTIHMRALTLDPELKPTTEPVTVDVLDAKGIKIFHTGMTTDDYGMARDEYIHEFFAIAQDLSPSMAFIEDVDFISQERMGSFRGTLPQIALLSAMDGIEEKTAIVTIATTNCVETLDKALSERPSRFDRVYRISSPDYQLRMEMLRYISIKTPLSEDIIEYIAKKTDGYTPAQVQEVPKGMVIAQLSETGKVTGFNQRDVDAVIFQMNCKRDRTIGFNVLPYKYTAINNEQNRRKESAEE